VVFFQEEKARRAEAAASFATGGVGGLGKVDVFFLAGGVDDNEAGLVEGARFSVDPDWNNGDARGGLEERHGGVSRTLDCVVLLARDFRLLHVVGKNQSKHSTISNHVYTLSNKRIPGKLDLYSIACSWGKHTVSSCMLKSV
jgi:hypothetical protein